MNADRIFVAGHRGLVGSAIVRGLRARGYSDGSIITRPHSELDLADPLAVEDFFASEKPQIVYLAAAKVGGIRANDTYPADFIRENLSIQTNVIEAAHRHGVARLLFLGSSCIYPREAPQPLVEDALLTGPLEPTNRPYALAKIAGIEMCWSYNRQFGTKYLAAMPTNLYGPGDNYHAQDSHVIPGLLGRFYGGKIDGAASVTLWGTGSAMREFLYADDMAAACIHLMELPDERYEPLLAADRNSGVPPMVNVGSGDELTIAELARQIAATVGYKGRLEYDRSKPDGTPRKLLDSSRIRALGWAPQTSLVRGLELAYADFLSKQEAPELTRGWR